MSRKWNPDGPALKTTPPLPNPNKELDFMLSNNIDLHFSWSYSNEKGNYTRNEKGEYHVQIAGKWFNLKPESLKYVFEYNNCNLPLYFSNLEELDTCILTDEEKSTIAKIMNKAKEIRSKTITVPFGQGYNPQKAWSDFI